MNDLQSQIERRRTFAIISHPDAGKTTLTEKLLLMGGAIRLAGSVKSRKSKKYATSDWMELEKQRGISVSTSVMNFEYQGVVCNLLDTPGHQDFSEDTYRTLAAADAAIMLIDGAKGVEPQTIKLFEVCRLRGIPVVTFVNKLDRECRDPFDLLHEVETVLGIPTYPMNWPVSSGERFGGIIERSARCLHFFEGRNTSSYVAAQRFPVGSTPPVAHISASVWEEALEGLEMLETAGDAFSQEDFLAGRISPVFFGAAMTSFGVQLFFETFLKLAPCPSAKRTNQGIVDLHHPHFSGFIFKIQANMDPKHRDRVAFLRVVSGAYEPGVQAYLPRLKREIRLSPPQQFFAQDRSTLEQAYAGDVVGIYDPGLFAIGDTLVVGGDFEFEGIPAFAPEFFAQVQTNNALRRKQMLKGLEELCQEGTVQMFTLEDDRGPSPDPILAAVGTLQFDVLLFRLENEYNVPCSLHMLPFKYARWTKATAAQLQEARAKTDAATVRDLHGYPLFLFKNDFALGYFQEHCPTLPLFRTNAGVMSNTMNVCEK